jgi:hypothetical protein
VRNTNEHLTEIPHPNKPLAQLDTDMMSLFPQKSALRLVIQLTGKRKFKHNPDTRQRVGAFLRSYEDRDFASGFSSG